MPIYRVLLRGQNFWLRVSGELQHLGFFTNRFVEAPDLPSAENLALDSLRADPKLRSAENDPADRPTIFIDDAQVVPASEVPEVVQGYVFFPEERQDDS